VAEIKGGEPSGELGWEEGKVDDEAQGIETEIISTFARCWIDFQRYKYVVQFLRDGIAGLI
jgi:hypothetical protein